MIKLSNELNEEDNLKIVLGIKEKMFGICDEMHFNKSANYKTYLDITKSFEMVQQLENNIIEAAKNCHPIIALEDTIIETEAKVEIKTNITNSPITSDIEIIFTGSIPSFGFLTISSEKTDEGIKIFAKNEVPKSVEQTYDLCGSHYCNPMIPRYFAPGIYRIEKDSVIGVCIEKEKVVDKNEAAKQLILDHCEYNK